MTRLQVRTLRALHDAEQTWTAALSHVDSGMYARPSGCGHRTIADLINHVCGGGERYGMLLAGKTAEETAATRNTDYVGDDPVRQFWVYENALRAVARTADLTAPVDHRAGVRSGHNLVDMRIMDLTLHAYDLGSSLHVEWQPADALVRYLLDELAPTIAELRTLGLFASVIATTSDDPADQLLALAGRQPAEPVEMKANCLQSDTQQLRGCPIHFPADRAYAREQSNCGHRIDHHTYWQPGQYDSHRRSLLDSSCFLPAKVHATSDKVGIVGKHDQDQAIHEGTTQSSPITTDGADSGSHSRGRLLGERGHHVRLTVEQRLPRGAVGEFTLWC